MHSPSTLRFFSVACLVVATACSDPTKPAPADEDDQATLDLAFAAGDAIAADVGFLMAGFDGVRIGGAPDLAASSDHPPMECSINAEGRHVCTGTGRNGMSITRSFAFYDASGTIQREFDPITTASVNFQLSVSGSFSREGHTGTISRTRDQTVSGLAGTETQRTWNGTGTGSHNGTATGARGTRTYSTVSHDTTSNVVVALPRSEHPWPMSGSIIHSMASTVSIEGERSGTRTIARRAKVTFNGTAVVTLEIGDRTCTLNLETRGVACPGEGRS